MAAETSWHRYETKLRHCHPVYKLKHFRCGRIRDNATMTLLSVDRAALDEENRPEHREVSVCECD